MEDDDLEMLEFRYRALKSMYAKQMQNEEKAANSNDNSIINDSYVPRRDTPRMETEFKHPYWLQVRKTAIL
ncbi:hypothetical protein Bhyg_02866 [Pseudolycoriella hygida]|uniref:Uncharacterized protein n=1 Tax=Pseudolycoriella hygida TaxID=35572 RepID=A0A9Q0NC89_9DIPT|nr:hypothetical protein Bhyg_02866 [Pseudolycoriella hygida]